MTTEVRKKFIDHWKSLFDNKPYTFHFQIAVHCIFNFKMAERCDLSHGVPRPPTGDTGDGRGYPEVTGPTGVSARC